MTLENLMSDLSAVRIVLSHKKPDKISCYGPPGALSPQILDAIKAHKSEILNRLCGTNDESMTDAQIPAR